MLWDTKVDRCRLDYDHWVSNLISNKLLDEPFIWKNPICSTKLGCTLESGWIPFEPWTKNANHVATYTLQVRFLFMVRGGRTYFTFYGASNKRTTLIDTIQSSILNLDVVAWSNFNSLPPYINFIQVVIADTPCRKNREIKKNLISKIELKYS